jgi:hypothetical protein
VNCIEVCICDSAENFKHPLLVSETRSTPELGFVFSGILGEQWHEFLPVFLVEPMAFSLVASFSRQTWLPE